MKLSSVQIERFGARSNLQLDSLSHQLNVVYGPNGSGKTTIIQFVRWMLFGSQDTGSQRYLTAGEMRVGGALQLVDAAGRLQTLTRHMNGAYSDQVRITGGDVDLSVSFDARRLTGIDLQAYQHIFSFGFDQPPSIEQMLRAAQTHTFDIAFDENQLQRMRELTTRLEELRRNYGYAPSDDYSMQTLLERRRQLQLDLDACERRRLDRLREWERENDGLLAEIAAERRHLEELENGLRRTESYLASRAHEADEAADAAWQQRDRWLDGRRHELARLDEQIQQWHQMLDRIRARHEDLQAQMVKGDPPAVLHSHLDEAELRTALRSLGHTLDDIDLDLRDVESVEETNDERSRTEYYRSILTAAWQSMRNDVHRMCRELQRQQVHSHYHEQARELDHLRRCETELTSLIDALDKRRNSLRGTPEMAQNEVGYVAHASLQSVNGYAGYRSRSDYRSTEYRTADYRTADYRTGDITTTAYGGSAGLNWPSTPAGSNGYYANGAYTSSSFSNTGYTGSPYATSGHAAPLSSTSTSGSASYGMRHRELDPVWQTRLAHLARRRDYLLARVRELESEIHVLEQRREALQSQRSFRDEERQAEMLRAEMVSVDERIRQIEQWQRRREEIESLERQIDQLRQQLAPSEILREASAILARLTDNACRSIRINDRFEVRVEDDRGHLVHYSELSRAARDQAYLAIALALVAAFRRRRIELPLVLNDVFINIDAERAQATAEVLAEFAAQGHQVLLFTHHEDVMQRFAPLNAKLYTLRERVRASEPYRTEMPVRPLPRTEMHYLDEPSLTTITRAPAPEPLPVSRHYEWASSWENAPRAAAERVVREPVAEIYRLSEDTLLSNVEGFDRTLIARLRELHVETVGEFMNVDPEDVTRRLGLRDVSSTVLFRLQSEFMLQCYVGLAPSDAALLVACGVDDPEELSYIDVSELHRRIESYLNHSDSRSRFGSIARFERSRLSRWIQAARRSHYRRTRPTLKRGASPAARPQPAADMPDLRTARPRTVESPRAARIPEPVIAEPRIDVRREERREETRGEERRGEERREAIRYFLTVNDPIVDAPSIGPKTAERFHAVGINTVGQLLETDAHRMAESINYRRITADLIRSWQRQTDLVCRVPNLRGHDAQILVACDIEDADQLAEQNPEALFQRVEAFVNSTEGKRVLRNAKSPDLSEISSWVRWARRARGART